MRLSTARDQFLADRRIGGPGRKALGPGTLQRYYFSVTGLIDYLVANYSRPRQGGDSVLLFKAELVREYIGHRASQDMAASTLAIDCAVLREFAKWGARKRYWRPEDVEDMPAVSRPELVPRPMTNEERDRVMMLPLTGLQAVARGLLYYTAARESEVLGLRLLDVAEPTKLPDGTEARGFIRVYGKGRKERIIDIHAGLWAVLGPHLVTLRGKPRDWAVLCRPDGRPWSYMMLRRRVLDWGEAANVPGLTCHRFRHSGATNMLEATNDLQAVQKLLGHAQITTTQGYAKVVDWRRRAAVDSLPTFPVQAPDSFAPAPTRNADA